jgi:hypothetical protein
MGCTLLGLGSIDSSRMSTPNKYTVTLAFAGATAKFLASPPR